MTKRKSKRKLPDSEGWWMYTDGYAHSYKSPVYVNCIHRNGVEMLVCDAKLDTVETYVRVESLLGKWGKKCN